jgi:glc operon protein GlcG
MKIRDVVLISRIVLFVSLFPFTNVTFGQTVEKKTLTLQGAERVIAAAKAEAQKLQAPGGVIAVVDDGGNLMALERLDGTFSAGANISIGKARTAVMFKKPTRFFEELINSSGKGRTVMTALENFTPLIGGIPITVDGQIVGGVGVSGAATADQDEKLAIAGATTFAQGASASSNPMKPILYFEKRKVDEAFSKGAVLLDGSDGRNYMVHASRREKPGQAEIHTKDADVIYVLQGSATFVTGGEAVDTNVTAPDELRGSSIRNGQTQRIAQGDVIVVPNGVPHQFLQVTNPFLYYVVKVR